MQLTTQDIVALYQLAREADIKAGRAVEVGSLFQRIEFAINAAAAAAATPVSTQSEK